MGWVDIVIIVVLSVAVLGVFGLVIYRKVTGKPSCDCGCGCGGNCANCHPKKK